ncbi:MAG TPA: carboxylesterase/lipase family protein [Acidimicrobiales bacterium]|nr:carboxylesterase/lipase family protein [Acidimicrobiales bacterium]
METVQGTVEGTTQAGYQRFLGIPYAQPPIGRLRFRAPQAPSPHAETFMANTFGPHAPQPFSMMEHFLGDGAPIVTDEAECLRLNVWTPSCDDARRPVMVWIHGGAFVSGTSATPWYDGARFCVDHDLVMVSFNYRLGVLGFTYLSDEFGSDLEGSGSLGIQDAVAALRWVRENIAHFGGDPNNVTIFGESAGAMSVGTLLAMPGAQGLFHKAILQSGAASSVTSIETATRYTNELMTILDLDRVDIDALQELPVTTLIEAHAALAAAHARQGLVSVPVIDGSIIDRSPLEAIEEGAASDIPLLIGTNRDEWRLFALFDQKFMATDAQGLASRLSTLLSENAAATLATYAQRLGDVSPALVLASALSDSVFRVPAIRLAEAQHRGGGSAWMYLFTWAIPEAKNGLGSCHAVELPFVFNTLDKPAAEHFLGKDPPRQLARDVNATWAAFARYGNPEHGAFGEWPPYDPIDRRTMIIDLESRVQSDPFGDERALWWESPSQGHESSPTLAD